MVGKKIETTFEYSKNIIVIGYLLALYNMNVVIIAAYSAGLYRV